MIVQFTTKHGRLTLLGESAVALLKLGGNSGAVPGAILAADLPDFLRQLRAGLGAHGDEASPAAPPGRREDQDKDGSEQRPAEVQLSMRAAPVIDMIETAIARGSDLMWECG